MDTERPAFIYELRFLDADGKPAIFDKVTHLIRGTTCLAVCRNDVNNALMTPGVARVNIHERPYDKERGVYVSGPLIETWTDRGALLKLRVQDAAGYPWFSSERFPIQP